MENKNEMDWKLPLVTRAGNPARLLTNDLKRRVYSYVVAVEPEGREGWVVVLNKEGQFYAGFSQTHPDDVSNTVTK